MKGKNNNNNEKKEKKRLTSIVNLPVSNSVRNGSDIGLMLSRSSTLRINSCCSNNSTARCTSSFRANTNFRAVDGEIVFRSILLFITSMNSLTACRGKKRTKMEQINTLKKWLRRKTRRFDTTIAGRLMSFILNCVYISAFSALKSYKSLSKCEQRSISNHTSNAHRNRTPMRQILRLFLSLISNSICHISLEQFVEKKRQNTLKTIEYNIQLEHTRAQNTSTLHINLIVPPFQFAIGSDSFFYEIFNQLHSIRTLNLIRETKFLQSIELRSNVRVDSFHLTLMKNSLTCSPETVHGKLQIEKNAYAHALTVEQSLATDLGMRRKQLFVVVVVVCVTVLMLLLDIGNETRKLSLRLKTLSVVYLHMNFNEHNL